MTELRAGLLATTAAIVAFCLVLTYLALQMRSGDDPAIGSGPAPAEARQVVVRRIVVRRVVEGRAPARPAAPAQAGTPVAAPVTAPAPAPVPVTRPS